MSNVEEKMKWSEIGGDNRMRSCRGCILGCSFLWWKKSTAWKGMFSGVQFKCLENVDEDVLCLSGDRIPKLGHHS